jgi:hypothetical protein
MPRHTHPRVRAKHSRVHLFEQRQRLWIKRWRQAKRLYGVESGRPHPEAVLRGEVAEGRWVFPPFDRPRSDFIDNMVTGRRCSCGLCRCSDPGWRPRTERDWRRVEELAW